MALKSINVLQSTFLLVFVVSPILISAPANAELAVTDGDYDGWEESITVKSGRVVACGGWLFDSYDGTGSSLKKCKGWNFTASSRNVVKAVSTSEPSDIFYFCRLPEPSKPTKLGLGYSCSANGWQERKITSSL